MFIFTLAKSIFLIHRFSKTHPVLTQKLKNFLIPHNDNNHTPASLRPKALTSYALIIILAKIIISSYLFFLLPTVLGAFTSIENEITTLINQSRQEAGAAPLEIHPELQRSAQAKAAHMVINDYFSHFGPAGKKPWDWIDYTEYSYSLAGENLAKDFITAGSAHRALMKSSTHKKNILNPNYQHLGLGISAGKISGRDTMVLVQMFGAPVTSSVLSRLETSSDVKANLETIEQELFGEPQPIIFAEVQGPGNSQNLTQVQAQNIEAAITKPKTKSPIQSIMSYFDYLAFTLLAFLIAALLVNIFIQIHHQKPKTIGTALLTIVIILIFMFTNFHFLEGIGRVITIR